MSALLLDETAIKLHTAIAAVCPIDGVSIGDPADKATWLIHFQSIATSDQQTMAQEVLTDFAVSTA